MQGAEYFYPIKQIWGLSTDSYNPISNFKEIRPVGAALIHAEEWTNRWTDMTEVIGAFRDNANAPNKERKIRLYTITITMFNPLEGQFNK
jgi:hypothetical protein